MPTLNWIGKDKVVNHASAVPFHVLEHVYNFGGESENKIIHGDNLLALKSLLPEYEGRIKCIYIDPPYNTQRGLGLQRQSQLPADKKMARRSRRQRRRRLIPPRQMALHDVSPS